MHEANARWQPAPVPQEERLGRIVLLNDGQHAFLKEKLFVPCAVETIGLQQVPSCGGQGGCSTGGCVVAGVCSAAHEVVSFERCRCKLTGSPLPQRSVML